MSTVWYSPHVYTQQFCAGAITVYCVRVVTFSPLDGDVATWETMWVVAPLILKYRQLVLSEAMAYFQHLWASPTCAHRWHSPLRCPWSSWTCWGIFYRSSESGLRRHPKSDKTIKSWVENEDWTQQILMSGVENMEKEEGQFKLPQFSKFTEICWTAKSFHGIILKIFNNFPTVRSRMSNKCYFYTISIKSSQNTAAHIVCHLRSNRRTTTNKIKKGI